MDDKMNKLIARLLTFSVPELCDGAGNLRVMDYQIKPMVTKAKIAGPAFTVEVPVGDGKLVGDAIEALQPGQIMVVAGKGHCASSYWGDYRSYCAKLQGAAGIIVDGAFRDVEGCEAVGFPVYAKALTCRTAGKKGGGEINVTVNCGGVSVDPGDIIVADRNGVIVFKPEEAEAAMAGAEDKIRRQRVTVEEMKRTNKVIPQIMKGRL